MRQFVIIVSLLMLSFPAFPQFPLGASKESISNWFAQNVQYASAAEFRTDSGSSALCFSKVAVLGDYTFYFNSSDECITYVETYGNQLLDDIIWRFDHKFCRVSATEWSDDDGTFRVTLSTRPKKGANYVSVAYMPEPKREPSASSLAAN